jgi:hypothetical protein
LSCAPYIAEESLNADGIMEVRYIEADLDAETSTILARGDADFSIDFVSLYSLRSAPTRR